MRRLLTDWRRLANVDLLLAFRLHDPCPKQLKEPQFGDRRLVSAASRPLVAGQSMLVKQWGASLGALFLVGNIRWCTCTLQRTRTGVLDKDEDDNCPLSICPAGFVARHQPRPPQQDGRNNPSWLYPCCEPSGAECNRVRTLDFSGGRSRHQPQQLQQLYAGNSSLVRNVLPSMGEINLRITLLSITGADSMKVDGIGHVQMRIGSSADLQFSLEAEPGAKHFKLHGSFYLGLQGVHGDTDVLELVEPASDLRLQVNTSSVAVRLRPEAEGGGLQLTSASSESDWFPRASLLFPNLTKSVSFVLQAVSDGTVPPTGPPVMLRLTGASAVACPRLSHKALNEGVSARANQQIKRDEAWGSQDFVPDDELAKMACYKQSEIKFFDSSVVYSNIAGMGPDLKWPKAMVFTDVFHNSVNTVDLHVVNSGEGHPLPMSRMLGRFGLIGVAGGTQVKLTFSFVNRDNGDSFTPTVPFYLTFLATARPTDKSADESYAENLRIDRTTPCVNVAEAQVHSFRRKRADGCVPLETTSVSTARDLVNPRNLPIDEKRIAAFLIPPNRSTVSVSFFVLDGEVDHDFLFAGATNYTCATLAKCSSMSCPTGFKPKTSTQELLLLCAQAECSEQDVSTCCEAQSMEECSDDRAFSMHMSQLLRQNLGGAGPDDGEEGMVFTDVFPDGREVIDLHISALTDYAPLDAHGTGRNGPFLSFNLKCGSTVELRLRFLGRVSKSEVQPPPFLLAGIDLGMQRGGKCAQTVEAEGLPILQTNASLLFHSEGTNMVRANSFVRRKEVPLHPAALSLDQEHRTVVFQVANRSEIILKLSTSEGSGSRDFRFAGPSSAACGQRALCSSMACPEGFLARAQSEVLACRGQMCGREDLDTCCEQQRRLSCASDMSLQIGCQVPTPVIHREHALNFPAVFTDEHGGLVDLSVAAPDHILSGFVDFGWGGAKVKLHPGDPLDLKLRFISRNGEPYPMKAFHLTLFDAGPDVPLQEGAQVVTSMIGVSACHIAPDSQLVINPTKIDDTGSLRYSSLKRFDEKDVVPDGHPMYVKGTRERMVTALVADRSEFNITLMLLPGETTAENLEAMSSVNWTLYFGGSSNLACPRVATCDSFVCPAGWQHKELVEKLTCTGAQCTDVDIETCCQSSVPDECETSLDLVHSEVVFSNLGGQGPNLADPEMILLRNVFPHASEIVDLEITAVGQYRPHNASRNGVWNKMGTISLGSGEHCELNFRFVDNATNLTKELTENMMMSWFHLYSDPGGKQMQVEMPDYLMYQMPRDSHLRLNGSSFHATTSMPRDLGQLGPVHPRALTWEEKRSTVSLVLPRGEGAFRVHLQAGEGGWPRKFVFSGSSSISCTPRAVCSTMTCPAGLSLREDLEFAICAGPSCGNVDLTVCCEVPAEDIDFLYRPELNEDVPIQIVADLKQTGL